MLARAQRVGPGGMTRRFSPHYTCRSSDPATPTHQDSPLLSRHLFLLPERPLCQAQMEGVGSGEGRSGNGGLSLSKRAGGGGVLRRE